jgi:hypothetical protein
MLVQRKSSGLLPEAIIQSAKESRVCGGERQNMTLAGFFLADRKFMNDVAIVIGNVDDAQHRIKCGVE